MVKEILVFCLSIIAGFLVVPAAAYAFFYYGDTLSDCYGELINVLLDRAGTRSMLLGAALVITPYILVQIARLFDRLRRR